MLSAWFCRFSNTRAAILSHQALGGHCTGLEVIGQVEEPGFLEGGDFTPAGQELALLGIGLRSNIEAARQLMEKDLLGSRRFAIVKDDFEQHQVQILTSVAIFVIPPTSTLSALVC